MILVGEDNSLYRLELFAPTLLIRVSIIFPTLKGIPNPIFNCLKICFFVPWKRWRKFKIMTQRMKYSNPQNSLEVLLSFRLNIRWKNHSWFFKIYALPRSFFFVIMCKMLFSAATPITKSLEKSNFSRITNNW